MKRSNGNTTDYSMQDRIYNKAEADQYHKWL